MKTFATRLSLTLGAVAAIAVACGPAQQKPVNNAGSTGSRTGGKTTGGKTTGGGSTTVVAATPTPTPPTSRAVAANMGSQNPTAQAAFNDAVRQLEQIRKDGSGSFDQPISRLESATSSDDGFALAWYDLGTIYEDLGKYDKAESAFVKAARANPSLGEATASLGRIYMVRGDVNKAKSFYADQLARDPKNKEVRNHLAEVHRREKNYAAAHDEIKKVLYADPDNVEAYKTLALTFMDEKKFDMAKMTSANALKIDANNAGVYNALGLVYLAQNDVRTAAAQFQTALDKDPGYSPALANLGAIALDHKDYSLAADCFGRLAKLKPSSPLALNAYAVALRGQKKNDEAKALYQRVHELDSSNVEVSFNLGVLYQKGYGDPDTAQRYYQDYISRANITDPKAPVMALKARCEQDIAARNMQKAAPTPKPEATPADNVATPDKDKGAEKGGAEKGDKPDNPAGAKEKPKAEKSGTKGAAKESGGKIASRGI